MSWLSIACIRHYSLKYLPQKLPKNGALVSVEKLKGKFNRLKFILPVEPTLSDWQTADAAVETTVGCLRMQECKEVDDGQDVRVHSSVTNLFTVEVNPYEALQIRLRQGLWQTSHTLENLLLLSTN